ncbi:MAG: hypothetical protein RLZZ623_3107 [Actinomycetota bacterium]|jgi:hypothetical protein
MLSWSSHEDHLEINLVALADGRDDVGLPLGAELLRFASAAADLTDGPEGAGRAEMGAARAALAAAAGEAAMVDAAAVAANFHMMTRLADGTGARYPAPSLDAAATTIASMGVAGLASRR